MGTRSGEMNSEQADASLTPRGSGPEERCTNECGCGAGVYTYGLAFYRIRIFVWCRVFGWGASGVRVGAGRSTIVTLGAFELRPGAQGARRNRIAYRTARRTATTRNGRSVTATPRVPDSARALHGRGSTAAPARRVARFRPSYLSEAEESLSHARSRITRRVSQKSRAAASKPAAA